MGPALPASAPARSTTRPMEIKATPVLTHESRVRSFARCSRTSVSRRGPCEPSPFLKLSASHRPLDEPRRLLGATPR